MLIGAAPPCGIAACCACTGERVRQANALQIRQRARGCELADSLGQSVGRVVQLREDFHEVEAVTDLGHAEILQVRLEEQEDDIALQLILDEARRVLAQAECAEPNAHVLGRPHEDVLWQPEVAQVRRAPHCRSCIICRLAIDVEFVKVTVAAPATSKHAW